ncbi:hypothetical protein V8F20_005520 [Naviculisporaceae sp. PSN 640]
MTPRLGLPADVDAITNVIIQAMPLDPQWDYRFPWRHEFPEDHYKYTRMLFEYFLDPSYDDWLVMVVEDSFEPGDDPQIVAFGVWDVSFANKRIHGPGYIPQDPVTDVEENGGSTRRDANHEHFNAFWKGQIKEYQKLFSPIGPEQMHMQILATLPDFQRRGHGSSLCKWAMETVRRERLKDMSVMASPMGYELYTWLGFHCVERFYIQVPGEEERLTLEAMIYKPGR